jgi:hypothetical protein
MKDGPKTSYCFMISACTALAERLVIYSVLQILWIYVIIKPMFDLKQSMTFILCLE